MKVQFILGKCYNDKIPFPENKKSHTNEINRNNTNSDQYKDDVAYSIGKEDTLWTVFHRLKTVFEIPIDESSSRGSGSNQMSDGAINQTGGGRSSRNGGGSARVHHEIRYDDSKRVVDMTEILPNLFIGDE